MGDDKIDRALMIVIILMGGVVSALGICLLVMLIQMLHGVR